jgi:hypothetical protein
MEFDMLAPHCYLHIGFCAGSCRTQITQAVSLVVAAGVACYGLGVSTRRSLRSVTSSGSSPKLNLLSRSAALGPQSGQMRW